jgi:hypothetical protein
VLNVVQLNAECPYTECGYAECNDAECQYAECRYSICHSAFLLFTLNITALLMLDNLCLTNKHERKRFFKQKLYHIYFSNFE